MSDVIKVVVLGLVLVSSSALADGLPQPPVSSVQQALGQKLLEEINANVQLRAQIIEKDRMIEQLKAPKDDKK